MNERRAIERVMARVYKDRLKKTGRLPCGKEMRMLEKKVIEAARRAGRER
ncbi:MAG: hypothetical protein HY884_06890 [Deltaproteobacteria bacterium]|nr:hypothetical protein [Deltaproteobacteria bacterium]